MNTRSNFFRYAVITLGLIVLILLVRDFNSRMADMRRLQLHHDLVATQSGQMVSTVAALETQIAYAGSEDGLNEYMYEHGNNLPGDKPVALVPAPGEERQAEPAPIATPQVIPNWQLWLALFVDDLPAPLSAP